MKDDIQQALQYVKNTNGGATIDIFMDDHKPIGKLLWNSIISLVKVDHNGRIWLTDDGEKVLNLTFNREANMSEMKAETKKRKFRMPVAKEGELLVKYGKEYGDEDLFYCYPDNECGMKRDSNLLMFAFEKTPLIDGNTLRKELELRGYDITTLKFSVMKKQPNK